MKNFCLLRRFIMDKVRSPLFYVGDKYKLMPQLRTLFPKNINTFYDVFCGGGSASLNTSAQKYVLNDLDTNVIQLHKFLSEQAKNFDDFLHHEYELIDSFGLTRSSAGILPANFDDIRVQFKKTYYAKINKASYLKLRAAFNADKMRSDLMYLLLVYGFNHMTRFNSKGNFNLPVGNVDWNNNVEKALRNYADFMQNTEIDFSNDDFVHFVNSKEYNKGDFLYFDPPYLITFSEYNKWWNDSTEKQLYTLLDNLNERGVKWGLSNVFTHKGKSNTILKEWAQGYNIYPIKANYISRFDNTIKANTAEVYITNVEPEIING